MPVAPAIIAALITAGVTGVTTGLEASGAIGGGGKPSAAPTPAETSQTRNALLANIQQQQGNVAQAGSGGLSPAYLAYFTGAQTGTSNDMSELLDLANQQTGSGPTSPLPSTSPSTATGAYGSTPSGSTPVGGGTGIDMSKILALLQQFQGGGSNIPPPVPNEDLSIGNAFRPTLSDSGLVSEGVFA